MKNCLNQKAGISLIAVLMFMLAATTASVVVFRYIGQENFSSAARLKNSEAYQASQAGLEAVQGWLTNKGADAGELIRYYETQNKPVLMCEDNDCNMNLLGGMESKRQQKFKVYLAGIDVSKKTYKLKFISEGLARDGSKYSQVGIFDVDGLHKTNVPTPTPTTTPKLPTFFGGVDGTQGIMTSGYLIGDVTASAGFGTTGDLIVTGTYKANSLGTSNQNTYGCPSGSGYEPFNNGRPSDYDSKPAGYFGNTYIKKNFSYGQTGFCGSLYVGENMEVGGKMGIWGDLYVGGNLTITSNNFNVYGNVTVAGNITLSGSGNNNSGAVFHKNLVLPSTNSTYTGSEKITVNGTTCKVGSNNPPVIGTIITDASGCKSTAGGNTLGDLGSQITGSSGNYTIPDPIVMDSAQSWETSTLPAICTAPISTSLSFSDFEKNVNDCYKNCSNVKKCNWKGKDDTQWLVIRLKWGSPSNYMAVTLDGNIIFVIEDKASLELPYTTPNSNVLLYLTKGAITIDLKGNATAQKKYNYFIYSKEDINDVVGSQKLTGNLFMTNGKKVGKMQDPTINDNESLRNALHNAGVFSFKGDAVTGPPLCEKEDCIFANDFYHVPLTPHLKVALQSQYANEESVANKVNAQASILVLPRIIYVQKGSNVKLSNLSNYYSILYLNGAKESEGATKTVKCISENCSSDITATIGTYEYEVSITNNSTCPNCKTSFYVIVTNTGGSS